MADPIIISNLAQSIINCDTNTFTEPSVAVAGDLDAWGQPIPAGAEILVTPDGLKICVDKSDTFVADAVFAASNPIDSNSTPITDGDVIVQLDNGELISLASGGGGGLQELFKSGSTLPANMVGTLEVRLADGSFVTLGAGDPLPAGSADVMVDEVTGEATCIVKSLSDPEIDLLKFTGDKFSAAGDIVEYTYCVLNAGDVEITSIAINDDVMGAIDTSSATLPLAAGEKTTILAPYTVTQADVDAGTIRNVAVATGTDANGMTASALDDAVAEFVQGPCISLVKTSATTTVTAPPTGTAIQPVTYTFEVTNCGPEALINVMVTDPLVAVSGGPIANLAAGATDTTTFTATYTPTQADVDAGGVTNTAQVDGTGADSGIAVSATDDHVITIEPCTGTTTVCGQLPLVSKRIPFTQTSIDKYEFEDPNSGAKVTLDLTITPSPSGCELVYYTDPTFVILGSDTACGPIPTEYISVDYKFTTDVSGACQTSTLNCLTDISRIRTRIRDVDVISYGNSGLIASCVTPGTSELSPVVPISGDFVEGPAGTFCAVGTVSGAGNLYIGDIHQPPATGMIFDGNIQWAAGGERIAFEVDVQYKLSAEVTVDCDGNIISAVDCNGADVADLTTITLL